MSPSANQLPMGIRSMMEERARAQGAAHLEQALACFKVHRRQAIKKIHYVDFDPIPDISTSVIKTYQLPPDLV